MYGRPFSKTVLKPWLKRVDNGVGGPGGGGKPAYTGVISQFRLRYGTVLLRYFFTKYRTVRYYTVKMGCAELFDTV